MSISKVAIIGATGNIGEDIHKALLNANFEVTVLTREGSSSTDSLPSHPNQKIVKVNYDDVDSIAAAFKGVDGVVCNVTSSALMGQTLIIDAAIKAGVKRFLPSEFGSDLAVEFNRSVLFNAPKVHVEEYLVEKTKQHPEFSYTSVSCGPFLDWCIQNGLFGDFKNRKMTLWDGGDVKFSTTTTANVGKAVVGVFQNLEATKNRTIRVSDTALSLKEIIAIAKEIDGKEWETTPGDTYESYLRGVDEFKKPQPNMMVAIVSQLMRIIFSKECEPDFEHKKDNEKVGLPTMSREQVKEVIARFL